MVEEKQMCLQLGVESKPSPPRKSVAGLQVPVVAAVCSFRKVSHSAVARNFVILE